MKKRTKFHSIFSSHAKQGGDYDAVIAEQTKAAQSPAIEEEIRYVKQWMDRIVPQLDVKVPIGDGLVQRSQ